MPFGNIDSKKKDAFKPDEKTYLVEEKNENKKVPTTNKVKKSKKNSNIDNIKKKNIVYTCNISISQTTFDLLNEKSKKDDRSISYTIARAVENYLK